MPWKKLLIYVEGQWDKLFFEKVICPQFKRKGEFKDISVRQWSNLAPKDVTLILKTFSENNHATIITGDKDSAPCITLKRIALQQKFSLDNYLNIIVVVKNIEHWYSAGITHEVALKLAIEKWHEGKILDKPEFERNRPQRFLSEIDFRQEILKNFSVDKARERSESLDYFFTKYSL
jgi:hypothetical protein